jgi:hypothetical protein
MSCIPYCLLLDRCGHVVDGKFCRDGRSRAVTGGWRGSWRGILRESVLWNGWEDAYTGSEDMIVDVFDGVMWLERVASREFAAELVVFGGRVVVFVGSESVGRDMA